MSQPRMANVLHAHRSRDGTVSQRRQHGGRAVVIFVCVVLPRLSLYGVVSCRRVPVECQSVCVAERTTTVTT